MTSEENPESKQSTRKATVRPSPLVSTIQLVMGIVFLIFGIALMSSGGIEAGPGQTALSLFLIIWILACLGIIIYSLLNLLSFKDYKVKPTATDVLEIEEKSVTQETERFQQPLDFETKLRKLESLRKDGLLTEEEYQSKKKEILDQKW
jgi:hypothetical protein